MKAHRALAACVLGSALVAYAAPPPSRDPAGTTFALADPQGRKRTLADFKGKVAVLYFGYTFCPDVCPTDLQQIARAMKLLGKKARHVQPLFVTLDPSRDTPELLGQYARAFHPRIVALRGSEEETQRLARAFNIDYRRSQGPGASDYSIDHAAYTILLGPDGKYADAIPPGTPAGRMAVMIE